MRKNDDHAIKVTGLKKSYYGKPVLRGADFNVEKGSIFCLLGSNGAGKTTTVKILSTLITQDEGTVIILGHDAVSQGQEIRKQISLTGQYAAVDEILTGRENLEMTARLCHVKEPKKHAAQLLLKFNLQDAADKRVAAYSGGMRRRLDIAMSLTGAPSIIFLDEPTTGLDPQSRNAMWEMIKELRAKGVTIFLTTQYLEEAELLADQVAILHEGKIIANGTVEEIKKLSANEYITFSFPEISHMNRMLKIFEDNITAKDKSTYTVTLEITEGITQLTNILTTMKEYGIISSSFSQKKASLEDVFLYLIEHKGGLNA